jgi:hypothetical protein
MHQLALVYNKADICIIATVIWLVAFVQLRNQKFLLDLACRRFVHDNKYRSHGLNIPFERSGVKMSA